MQLQSVVGVGTEKDGNSEIIKIFVSKKTKTLLQKIPKEIEGYKVKVEKVGDIYAQK